MGFIVGIPTLICYKHLDKLISSILKSSILPDRIIIMDQGGSYANSSVEVVPTIKLNVSSNWNDIHGMEPKKPIFFINDDVEVAPDTFEKMLLSDGLLVTTIEGNNGFSCFLIRPELWSLVGKFDEQFRHYLNDSDYLWRMRLREIYPKKVPTEVTHKYMGTYRSSVQPQQLLLLEQMKSARVRYLKKWRGLPRFETSPIPYVLEEREKEFANRVYLYLKHGVDQRRLEFLENNMIGIGIGEREQHWTFQGDTLTIWDRNNPLCSLKKEGDRWNGKWHFYEKHSVSLIPLA